MKRVRIILACVLCAGASFLAHAQQAYPNRPLRLVVNFAAGGTSDVLARALARPLEKELGQPVIVDNRAGALGVVGAADVSRAAPDGYTVLLTTQGSLTEHPVLMRSIAYDPLAAFAPVSLIGESPMIFFAHPSFPANNMQELIALGRKDPQGVSIAVSGSTVKLGVHSLMGATGAKLVQIPYGGLGPVVNAVLAGHTPVALNTSTASLMQNVQAGKLKLLAVASKEPSALVPGVPYAAQTIPGYEVKVWWGIFAPAGTPGPVVAKLNAAFRQAVMDPSVSEVYASNSVAKRVTTPEELGQLVTEGLARTKELVREHGIQPE